MPYALPSRVANPLVASPRLYLRSLNVTHEQNSADKVVEPHDR